MKFLPLLFVIFSLFSSAHAQNLCDESCDFSVTFPQGGSLQAIDELTLIFGVGGKLTLGTAGTVNTAIQPSNLDFSSGGTLHLAAGESITFGPGGSLITGAGGNINAINYNLNTTGDISVEATGGAQHINLAGEWGASGTLSFASPSIEINSTITTGAQLNLANSTMITGAGSIEIPETTTVTVGNVTPVQTGTLTLTSSSGVIDTSNAFLITPVNTPTQITGSLSIQPLSSLDTVNGFEMPTSDGGTCTVTSPECVADDGTIYVLSTDGELVKKEANSDTFASGNSGSISLPVAVFFMIGLVLFKVRRGKKVKLIEIRC